jgi:hypothetical protein
MVNELGLQTGQDFSTFLRWQTLMYVERIYRTKCVFDQFLGESAEL